ncbi:MAG TPA: hypothetical protein VMF08_20675 [Candidatus Sulfotelmatobacter sp.]|nr:hypothetical protein [Candidatus Sulfotelmatobacter sp.]
MNATHFVIRRLATFLLIAFFMIPLVVRPQGPLSPGFELYLSNLSEPLGGSTLYGSDSWIAQSFETGPASAGYILNGPILINAMAAPTTESSFYSNNGGVPGISLGDGGITLSPSTLYWLVLTASDPSQSSGGVQVFTKYWNYASDANYSSPDNWSLTPTFALSSDGLNWTPDTSHSPFEMEITATPVPEPTISVLGGTALAVFLLIRKNFCKLLGALTIIKRPKHHSNIPKRI